MSEYTGSLISYSFTSSSVDSKNNFYSNSEYFPNSYINVNIVYRMRAYNSLLQSYVYWYSNQEPDIIGKQSGYPLYSLSDIQVQNRRFI